MIAEEIEDGGKVPWEGRLPARDLPERFEDGNASKDVGKAALDHQSRSASSDASRRFVRTARAAPRAATAWTRYRYVS